MERPDSSSPPDAETGRDERPAARPAVPAMAPPPERFRVVEDPEQARLLSDPAWLGWLEPFLARERRVGEVARERGARLDAAWYRVARLAEAGLLVVVREEPRAGRAIKVYRSDADAYFVPFAATPFADLRERLREETRPLVERATDRLARLLARHGAEGRRIYRGRDGQVWHDASDAPARRIDPFDPARPPAEWLSGELRLREEDAREMLARLLELWSEMEARRAPEGEGGAYLAMMALLPDRVP